MLKYVCNGVRVYQEKEYLGRKGCGQDLTPLIADIPADGKDYAVTCPKCGNVGMHMRTPSGAML